MQDEGGFAEKIGKIGDCESRAVAYRCLMFEAFLLTAITAEFDAQLF